MKDIGTLFFFGIEDDISESIYEMHGFNTNYYRNGSKVGYSESVYRADGFDTTYYANGSKIGTSKSYYGNNVGTTYYTNRKVGTSESSCGINGFVTTYYIDGEKVGKSTSTDRVSGFKTIYDSFSATPSGQPQYSVSELKSSQKSPISNRQPALFQKPSIPSLDYHRPYTVKMEADKEEESCCSCLIL